MRYEMVIEWYIEGSNLSNGFGNHSLVILPALRLRFEGFVPCLLLKHFAFPTPSPSKLMINKSRILQIVFLNPESVENRLMDGYRKVGYQRFLLLMLNIFANVFWKGVHLSPSLHNSIGIFTCQFHTVHQISFLLDSVLVLYWFSWWFWYWE